MRFKRDVEQTKGLQGQFCKGLQALRKQDRQRISVANPIGSVDIDTALVSHFPNASRWDYLVGQRRNAVVTMLHWIEVHSTDGEHTAKEVEAKFHWLIGWVAGTPFKPYESRFYWVSSGKSSLNSRSPRVKVLAQLGIAFSGQFLGIS
jgi:hypothetical protein